MALLSDFVVLSLCSFSMAIVAVDVTAYDDSQVDRSIEIIDRYKVRSIHKQVCAVMF